MKKLIFRAFCLAMAAMLLLTPAFAAGTNYTTGGLSGGKLMYIDMSGATLDVAVANNSIHTDAPASSIISAEAKATGKTVIAAVNGGFFNAYYKTGKALTVPDNYPRVYSTVMKNGAIINAGGTINAIGCTASGKVLIDRVELKPVVNFDSVSPVTMWGTNVYYSDASAIYALTDIMDYAVPVPSSSIIISIKNGAVISVSNGTGSYVVPNGTMAVVVNSGSYLMSRLPGVGERATYTYTASPQQSGNSASWSSMKTVAAGGLLLVQAGVDVSRNNPTVTAADQQPDVVSQRSFAAVMNDGRLLFGTCNSSFAKIAQYLVSIGARDALSLDGGASSMLYSKTNGTVTAAGRELATVLVVLQEGGAQGPAVQRSPQKVTVDGSAVSIEGYNIAGSNYFMLRDIAYVLRNTGSRFGLSFSAPACEMYAATGESYEPNGSECRVGGDKSASCVQSTWKMYVNGQKVSCSIYNMGGNNFLKLRDMGAALDFGVDYDAATNTAVIKSK